MMELIHDWEEKINKLESDWQLWEKERLELVNKGSLLLSDHTQLSVVISAQRVIKTKIDTYTECLDQVSKLALAMSDL